MARTNFMRQTVSRREPTVRTVVKQILDSRIEPKLVNATGALADFSASGVVNTISMNVTQGDDIGNRAGDLIYPKELRIRGEFGNFAASYLPVVGRVIVFQDTLCVAATPAVLDVLATANPLSPYSAINRQSKRFKILYDKTHSVVAQTSSKMVVFDVVIPMSGSISYLGSTGVAGNQGRNSLFALFISDFASAGEYRFAWSYELKFQDA